MDMEREIKKTIDIAISKGAKYADFRCSEKEGTSVEHKNGKVENISTGNSFTGGLRVLYNGSWGFASSNSVSGIADLGDVAFGIAKSMQKMNKSKDIMLSETKTVNKDINYKRKTDLNDLSIDDKLDFVRKGHAGASKISSEIKSVSVRYSDFSSNNVFANSEGSYILSNPQYFIYYVFSNARRGDRIEEAYNSRGSFAGIDELVRDNPYKIAASASRKAVKLLDATLPPSGNMPVILDSSIGGLFVHEAVGHASEADLAMKGSVFKSRIGEKLGSHMLNIVDDPHLRKRNGYFLYDDEGVRGKKTVIFRKGVLESYMHSRESAAEMGVESTGNARAQSAACQPIVRMSNTYFNRGEMQVEELFEGMKKGVSMEGFKGGQVNIVDGTFTFGAERGHIIENGKKTTFIKDCSITGKILDVLGKIDGVANNFLMDHIGFCGKEGQTVPVSNGAPSFRVSKLLVGGQSL
ncbi:MAG: TldD/PmbA family protein [archaeon]|nr:TldD/PmbA family protein [archaeon]